MSEAPAALVRGMARLRHASFVATGFYPGGPAALAYHRERLAEWLPAGAHWRLGPRDAPRAFVLRWTQPDPPTTLPTTFVFVHRVDDAETAAWARAVLPAALDGIPDAELEVLIPSWDREVRDTLAALGVRVVKVDLAGRVDVASERFAARWGDPPPPPPGARDAEPGDADAMIALYREVFVAEPAFGAHLAQSSFLERERERIRAGLPPGLHRVVEVDGAVRGIVHATLQVPNVHHGSSAGLDLVFGSELRGRGLARWAYGEILAYLRTQGVGWLKGATARPAVMHIGRILGRGVTGVTLRRDVAFPDGWFDAVLPG